MITIHQECVQISSRNSSTEKPLEIIQLKRAAGERKGAITNNKKRFSNVVQFIGIRLLSGNLFSSCVLYYHQTRRKGDKNIRKDVLGWVVSDILKCIFKFFNGFSHFEYFFFIFLKIPVTLLTITQLGRFSQYYSNTMPYNDPLMCLNKWCSAIHLDIQADDE